MEKDFLPNRDNGKHPASQVTIDFIRNVYSENSFNGFISLDMRDINGSFRHIASVECSKLEQYISLMAIYGNYHYYISANSFSKVNRSRDTLFALHNIVTSTIHSLIGPKPHKINCDVLIVDEASMIDIKLFRNLLNSIRKSTYVVFCGDPDQLPCVGGGDVLKNMITSGKIPVAMLTQIHRQTAGSSMIRLAHRIKTEDLCQALDISAFLTEDLMLIRSEDEATTQKSILDTVASLLAAGINPNDIQILAATNDWCDSLNPQLRTVLNPAAATDRELNGYTTGDRVLFLENDYALQLHNGEIGTILNVLDRHLEIDCGNSTVKYRREDLGKLSLAYAMTIHKAQGSEYPMVIIPIHKSMGQALTRNLVYTALTRAKKKCILVGSEETLLSALKRTGSHKSLLSERLTALLP